MGKLTSFYKVVTPNIAVTKVSDYQSLGDQGTYGNYTWFQRLIQGSTSRLTRYREYDLMDDDVDVARALDIIAEEMTGNVASIDDTFEINFLDSDYEQPSETDVITLKTALKYWYTENEYDKLLFHIARTTVKYGDCFFRRVKVNDAYKLQYIHPRFVTAAIVDILNVDNILAWQVKRDIMVSRSSYGTPITSASSTDVETIPANEMVRFTLNNSMSESAPFGESILRPVYKVHAQKQLLEDAIVIYRIQRAPERRVFYIDVGKMPVHKVKAFLEQFKNEFKQKKIPTYNGGQNQVESVYNPQSMTEDFFFSVRPDGKGSRVETLPGGQGLGELSDLDYFMDKLFRGLRIPSSYVKQGNDSVFNDGKVGMAYIQEARFALFVERMQKQIGQTLDEEFKQFLTNNNINLDSTNFNIALVPPDNFGTYRQEELNAALLSSYSSADAIPYLSKRMILKKYLQFTDDEIVENQKLLAEERNIADSGNLQLVYSATPPSDDMYGHQDFSIDNVGSGGGVPGAGSTAGQDMTSGEQADQQNTEGGL